LVMETRERGHRETFRRLCIFFYQGTASATRSSPGAGRRA
jgi:hypothetical protein